MDIHEEHVALWHQVETTLHRERLADSLIGHAAASRQHARRRRLIDVTDPMLAHAAIDAPDSELVDRLIALDDLGVRDQLIVQALRATGRHRDGAIDRFLAKAGLSPQRRLAAFGLEPGRRYRRPAANSVTSPASV